MADDIAFLFPEKTLEMAQAAAAAERHYLIGTYFEDGPLEEDRFSSGHFFEEVLPLANDLSMLGSIHDYDGFDDFVADLEEERLMQTLPLRGLKHQDRKVLIREYKVH